MNKKYEFTGEEKEAFGLKLKRIRRTSDGLIGGWIEKEENLSQSGLCFVYNNARVFGNAKVFGNAEIYGNAKIYDNAEVFGNARVCGGAKVFGNAEVCDNAKVSQDIRLNSGVCKTNLETNLIESVRCQISLLPINNKVIAYKQVRKDMCSFYEPNFRYKIGEYAEVLDAENSNESCSSGLHFSNANYWNNSEDILESTFLIAEIDLADIITVQEGKIRCRRAKILGSYDIK